MQAPLLPPTHPPAVFEPTRTYRYSLYREWGDPSHKATFIMLNPSTADEVRLDPTVTRCCGYAKRWGYGCIEVANIFAYRSTDPKGLLAVADAALVVAAWGGMGRCRTWAGSCRTCSRIGAASPRLPRRGAGTVSICMCRGRDPPTACAEGLLAH